MEKRARFHRKAQLAALDAALRAMFAEAAATTPSHLCETFERLESPAARKAAAA